MKRISIEIDNKSLEKLKNTITSLDSAWSSILEEGVSIGAEHVSRTWKNWIRGEGSLSGIDDFQYPDNKLATTVKIRKESPLKQIVFSESPKMESIVEGHKEYDMKNDAYLRGKKSRVSKKGNPYLIIPFRWGTPNRNGTERAHFRNVIPKDLYSVAKKFRVSKILDEKITEFNARNEAILRNTYTWGSRLKTENPTDHVNGLVRMKDKGGYFTFRIISSNSPKGSWRRYKGGVPGIDLEKAIIDTTEKDVIEIMEEYIFDI